MTADQDEAHADVSKASCGAGEMWSLAHVHFLLQARANGEGPVHGDDAHAAVTRMVWACEHARRTCVVFNVGWLQVGLIDKCSNKDAHKSENKTPTPSNVAF